MALAAQPMHSSRTVAVAVLPLASFLMVTFCSDGMRVNTMTGDVDEDELGANLVAVLAIVVDVVRDGDDLVAVDVLVAAGPEADVEPGTLRTRV